MAQEFIRRFSLALDPETERLGEAAIAIEEFSRRVAELNERAKKKVCEEEFCDISPGPKVPRISALGAVRDQPATEGARSPVETTANPQPRHEPGDVTAPSPPKKRGRPVEIDFARKEAALAVRERGDSRKKVAKVLYANKYPTDQQVKNAPNVLNNYKRESSPSRDHIHAQRLANLPGFEHRRHNEHRRQ